VSLVVRVLKPSAFYKASHTESHGFRCTFFYEIWMLLDYFRKYFPRNNSSNILFACSFNRLYC